MNQREQEEQNELDLGIALIEIKELWMNQREQEEQNELDLGIALIEIKELWQ